jgi:diguanylate cyclase (GGDEF)-like protein
MIDRVITLLTTDFMPHGYCFLWLPEVLWLHVGADALIALSYYMIPAALMFFIRARREVPFHWLFVLFSAFILACGTTHLFNIWTIWNGTYGAEGLIKLATGLISFVTAVTLLPVIPKALALPSPTELGHINRQLQQEIAQRQRIELELRSARDELQRRVDERTAELKAANARLLEEVGERKRAEERALSLAQHDALTGLPNRMLLHDRLQQALGQACRSEWRVAVMLLDLDDFKHTNDTLGHLVGDRLLQVVAARIGKVIRVNDTVARLGGDEFAIIQNGLQDTDAAATLADRIVETVSEVYDIDGNEVYIGTSIGITVFPDDTSSPEQLLSNADLALYRAKAQGGGTFQFFAPKMVEALRQRKGLERDLRRAMQRDELALVYQPQIDLTSRRIVGVEALLRWQSPECGLVSPSMFVSVAESTGLIRPIGDWVLREACRQAKSWADQGCPLRVAVNVSPGQFRQQDMYEKMLEALSATSLPPDLLELEITEGLFVDNDAVAPVLQRIAGLGVGLSIDDFGTGYSSLTCLNRFPLGRIKVDKSFVQEIGSSADAEAIVRAVIGLGHSLGKTVTAEGVETAEQFAFLREYDCDEAQGFLISRPLGTARLYDLLAAQQPEGAAADTGMELARPLV